MEQLMATLLQMLFRANIMIESRLSEINLKKEMRIA